MSKITPSYGILEVYQIPNADNELAHFHKQAVEMENYLRQMPLLLENIKMQDTLEPLEFKNLFGIEVLYHDVNVVCFDDAPMVRREKFLLSIKTDISDFLVTLCPVIYEDGDTSGEEFILYSKYKLLPEQVKKISSSLFHYIEFETTPYFQYRDVTFRIRYNDEIFNNSSSKATFSKPSVRSVEDISREVEQIVNELPDSKTDEDIFDF